MDKKILANIISEALLPHGFKRKGNYWVINDKELNKIVNLQKSNFGNFFYINYGFIINSIPLIGWKEHVSSRLGSIIKKDQKRITELLDLRNNIPDEIRAKELKKFINDIMVNEFQAINTEEDILKYLKNQQNMGALPIEVKKYFNLLNQDQKPKSKAMDSKTTFLNLKKMLNKLFVSRKNE